MQLLRHDEDYKLYIRYRFLILSLIKDIINDNITLMILSLDLQMKAYAQGT